MTAVQTAPSTTPLATDLPDLRQVSRHWWTLVLRGLAAIALGLLAFRNPITAVGAFILMYGIYAIVDGVIAVFAGIRSRWLSEVVMGVISILAGLFALSYPLKAAFVMIVLIAAFAVIRGVAEILAAIRLRKVMQGEWLLGLAGVASIIFGVLLFRMPVVGAFTLVWLWASMAVIYGVLLIATGFEVKRLPAAAETA